MNINEKPSMDAWLLEAKADPSAAQCGMYLFHCGVVRESARAAARGGEDGTLPVKGMLFSFDAQKAEAAKQQALAMTGIKYIRVWLAQGELSVGDDIMRVLVGGDIRPHVIEALQFLVGELKTHCVDEKEMF